MPLPITCFDLTPFASGSRFRGIGTFAFETARAMARLPPAARAGLDVRLLVGRNSGMRVVPLGEYDFEALFDGKPQPSRIYQLSKCTFGRAALARAGTSLYHATDPKGTPVVLVGKAVVSILDLIPTILGGPYLGLKPRAASWVEDWVRYHRPAHLIAISQATRESAIEVLGVSPERISVVPLGVDPTFFSPRPEPGEAERVAEVVGTSARYFLYVGAFDARKRVPLLVEAFGRVAAETDCDLVLAGRLEALGVRAAIAKIAARHGVSHRVKTPDFVPRALLPAIYRRAVAHTFPSVFEGFGLTVLEAMACGCPTIACPVTAMPEVAGDAAAWVPPDDADALAGAMREVAQDAERAASLSEAGLERARRFTWSRVASDTLDVYRRVLGA